MKEMDSKMLALQETRIETNSREARGEYTWYMSGENKQKDEKYTGPVGFVINNKYITYIEDVIPHTDRLIQIKLKGTCNINLINVYMPPANRTEEEKVEVYKKLDGIISRTKGNGRLER